MSSITPLPIYFMRYRVGAISGALQEDSKVTNIAKKCSMLKTMLDVQFLDIKNVPLINVDMFPDKVPSSVLNLRDNVHKCDGLIFIVPEFFGKVSPAFKNVYDWLSYSHDTYSPSPIRGMPACMISVGGEDGTAIQKHMNQISQFCRLRLMARPNLHYNQDKLDSFGKHVELSSGKDIEELQNFLQYFEQFIGKKGKNK